MALKDYYQILGVGKDASPEEIKKRFRQLARETHPDANPDDPNAEARFREVAEAYEVLSDPDRRARYDRGESMDFGDMFSSFGGLNEILEAFFGGGGGIGGFGRSGYRRDLSGSDLSIRLEVTLAEAALGASKELKYRAPGECTTCSGTGAAKGTVPETCGTCNGQGAVQVNRRTLLGTMATVAECSTCHGRGKVVTTACHTCRGRQLIDEERSVTVEVPAGVDNGARLRLRGHGGVGIDGAPGGDLYVTMNVTPDPVFERQGEHLFQRVVVPFTELTLGTEIEIPLIDGDTAVLTVPVATQPGTRFRMRGEGAGRLNGRGRGDLYIDAATEVPENLSKDEEALLRQFAELRKETPAKGKRRRR